MSSAGSITLSIDDAQHKIFPPWIASEHPELQLITFLYISVIWPQAKSSSQELAEAPRLR